MPTTAPTLIELKYSCGLCASGHHELCPGAIWNPGSGEIKVPASGSIPAVYEGEAKWCPCPSTEHTGPKLAKCRQCGERRPAEELTLDLKCVAVDDCRMAALVRTEKNPLYQMLQECQTTTLVAGEVKERPRRLTGEKLVKARAEKKEAQARPCTCKCGGTTKGGAFLPGHDARYVSQLVKGIEDAAGFNEPERTADRLRGARELLAQFPALLAKFEKRIAK